MKIKLEAVCNFDQIMLSYSYVQNASIASVLPRLVRAFGSGAASSRRWRSRLGGGTSGQISLMTPKGQGDRLVVQAAEWGRNPAGGG